LYHGTQQINQGQMDRWNIVTTLNYLPAQAEADIVLSKIPAWESEEGRKKIAQMVSVADLTRRGFIGGELSIVMSPRTVAFAFRVSFLNKCDETERTIVAEYYQRCLGEDLTGASAALALKAVEK
ncbi:MAG: hypothetical protein ACPGAD_05440, partial [Pseudomonadales bacterium]